MDRGKLLFILVILFVVIIWIGVIICGALLLSSGTTCAFNLDQSSKFYLSNTNISNIIITFTTMPDRMHSSTFKRMVSSTLDQSMRAQEIRANIPYELKKKGTKYIIPEWLLKLPITIVRVDDLGPATKFLSALKDYAGTKQRLLVCDDDQILHVDSVKEYHIASSKYPNAAITGHGAVFPREFNPITHELSKIEFEESNGQSKSFVGQFNPVVKLFLPNNPKQVSNNKFEPVDLLYGCFSYSITCDMINYEEFTDWNNMPKEAFFVDDIVLSAHLAKNKVVKIVAPNIHVTQLTYDSILKAVLFYVFRITNDSEALSETTNTTNRNNNIVIKHFMKEFGKAPLNFDQEKD